MIARGVHVTHRCEFEVRVRDQEVVAVRLDPGGSLAGPSYDLLEEYLITGYGGIHGTELPSDLQERLALLLDMMDAAAMEALIHD